MNDSKHILCSAFLHIVKLPNKTHGLQHTPHYLHIPNRLCGQNLNRNVRVCSSASCPQMPDCYACVCVCSGVDLCRFLQHVFVWVCVSVTVCHWCTCLHSFQRIIHFLLKWGSSPSEEGLKGGREQAFILFQQQLVVWGVNTSAGHRDREREGQGEWERSKENKK